MDRSALLTENYYVCRMSANRIVGTKGEDFLNEALEALVASLTAREMQVFKFIGKGFSNPQIAKALCITLSTVKAHVSNIFVKLKVDNRSKAAVIATKILETELENFSCEAVKK